MNEFWSKRSPRERAIFTLSLGVAAVFVISTCVVRPYETLLDSRSEEIQSKEIRLAKYKQSASLKGVQANVPEALARVTASGGQEEEMSHLLKIIESAARESSIRVNDLKPLPIEDRQSYQEFEVDLQTEASLEALTRFLYRIQTSPYLLSVPRFSLTSTQGAFGGGRLRLSLTVARILLPSVESRESPKEQIVETH